ncbi:MAG TPA: S8 family serine peptidase [Bryobacteraceae bacterium]|nr:S8 family serine peptidase [Bryobacteraceae bacterium]
MHRTLLLAAALGVFVSGAIAQEAVSHIVVLKEGADLRGFAQPGALPPGLAAQDRGVVGAVRFLEQAHGFAADHVYSHAIRGFAARLTNRQVEDLNNSSIIEYIELDGEMKAIAQALPWGIDKIDADVSSTLAGNGSGTVANVNVYVIDTGVSVTHPDLNVVQHQNFAGGPNDDCNGHGSHVAGTIAARDNTTYVVGVAPGAPITGVKVLGCSGSGSTSGVIAGVDWVTANARKPAIANMSLGGGASTALDRAVQNSADSGVFYALAAGNEGADACTKSPARAGAGTNNGIMTVAAVDSSEREASWSNYGSCVDIWAPGVSILSTYKGTGTKTLSGTSMASPHVGGGGALYLSGHTSASPSSVEQTLKGAAVSTPTRSKDGKAITRLSVVGF